MQTGRIYSIKNAFLCGFLFLNSVSHAQKFQLQDSAIMASHKLGKINLLHDEKGFFVECDGLETPVKNYCIDPQLRNINTKQLQAFQNVGYIQVKQLDNGEFSLKAHTRGVGGGFGLGYVAYWGTRITGYGVYGVLVWTSGGEALIHATETVQLIEAAANSAFILGVAAPTF